MGRSNVINRRCARISVMSWAATGCCAFVPAANDDLESPGKTETVAKKLGNPCVSPTARLYCRGLFCTPEEPAMRPGEYVPDSTEGITRVEDLPEPFVVRRSRDSRRRPCPLCGRSCFRHGRGRRVLHDLGCPLRDRPRRLQVIYSQRVVGSRRASTGSAEDQTSNALATAVDTSGGEEPAPQNMTKGYAACRPLLICPRLSDAPPGNSMHRSM
jgi:hypothetical protein